MIVKKLLDLNFNFNCMLKFLVDEIIFNLNNKFYKNYNNYVFKQ